ncbi:Hypothetical Protein FCC1311_023812 [Hondaea fermentalgiana]|uniref:Voltage-gated hydrogen channel 1 n=1 Tax=Hondaea fermentalgiana TaxID=2315210 RepID=A0A2R5GDA6_9STRA|nr:Hypothetical Protein FCC1311_023812 [Hondaea fermentalgiana]|eukprot:GBG26161.1 Hypothetical Protein FCC1311_023812 [Hondaea fermentalgiana]
MADAYPDKFTREDYDKRIKCYVSEREEVAYVDVEYNSLWRSSSIRWLHARNTQYTLTGLLMFDVILLFAQVFLDAHFPPCYAITNNAECVDSSGVESLTAHIHCEEHSDIVHSTSAIMYVVSLVILIIFEIELVLAFITLGPFQFLRNLSYQLDIFIVTTSIALEILLHETEDDAIASALIIARVWRLIRISHGLFTTKRRQLLANIVTGEENVQSEAWEEESVESARRKSRVASVSAAQL